MTNDKSLDKQLERCLSWALQGLSEHEAWAVKEEVNNAIRRASKGSNDRLNRLRTQLEVLQQTKDLADRHEAGMTDYPYVSEMLRREGYNTYKAYLEAGIRVNAELIIKDAGSAEEAGINKQGEEFHPDHDCPKCGGELDVEYKICGCGYFDEGNADLLTDMRVGK